MYAAGTFCVSRICQLYPQAVQSLVLLDPVTMLICHPQLLYNL
jgi:poly(A) polymerase Pap1